MKPGYKTTEFWLTLAAQLVALFLMAGLFPDTHVAVKVAAFLSAALASLGYTAARASAKKAPLSETKDGGLLPPNEK